MPAYKDEKTKKWYCQFYIKDWTGKNRHIVKRGFDKKSEALKYEVDYKSNYIATNDVTFSTLVVKYLENYKLNNRASSTQTIEGRLDKITPYFGKMKLSEITPDKIIEWTQTMNKEGLSASYLKTIMTTFGATFNFARIIYGYKDNPLKHIKPPKVSKHETMKIWTPDQYNLFIGQVKNEEYRLAFDILFYTGCRVGECLALCPSDILPNKAIQITKTIMTLHNPLRYEIGPTKTYSSRRIVTIPEFLYNNIQVHLKKLYKVIDNEPFFYCRPFALRNQIKKISEAMDLPRIRIHDFRHSHASLLIDMGANVLLIAQRLGHQNPQITLKVYAHLFPDKQETIASALNQFSVKPVQTIDTIAP